MIFSVVMCKYMLLMSFNVCAHALEYEFKKTEEKKKIVKVKFKSASERARYDKWYGMRSSFYECNFLCVEG